MAINDKVKKGTKERRILKHLIYSNPQALSEPPYQHLIQIESRISKDKHAI